MKNPARLVKRGADRVGSWIVARRELESSKGETGGDARRGESPAGATSPLCLKGENTIRNGLGVIVWPGRLDEIRMKPAWKQRTKRASQGMRRQQPLSYWGCLKAPREELKHESTRPKTGEKERGDTEGTWTNSMDLLF